MRVWPRSPIAIGGALLVVLLLSSSVSNGRADTSSVSVISVSYKGGAPGIDVGLAIPSSIDSTARSGGADPGVRVIVSYTSSNQTFETLDSGLLSIANNTTLGASIDAQTVAISLTVPLGSHPPPGYGDYSACAVLGAADCTPVPLPRPDTSPPSVTVTTPADFAIYDQNQVVNADYSCQDETALASCVGTVANGAPIDTATGGTKYFTVNAKDAAGNLTTVQRRYFVPPAVDSVGYKPGSASLDVVLAIPSSIDAAARTGGADWRIRVTVTYTSGNQTYETVDSGLVLLRDTFFNGAAFDSITDAVSMSVPLGSHPAPGGGPGYQPTLDLVPPPDTTPPTITLTTPPEGSAYTLNQTVPANYSCQDEAGGSGLASCAGPVANGVPIDTSSVGAKSFTVNAADLAGNGSSLTNHYTVGYKFGGFLAPVNNPATVNTGKAGKTYPIKWQLTDANNSFISTLSAVSDITWKATACSGFTSDPTDALETSTTGGTSLRYDSTANQYNYNWATPTTKGCYTLFLKLTSGQTFTAFFNLS